MNDEYLAAGFGHVDASADGQAYKTCLSLLDSLPYYREYKQRSYELLDLLPGVSVLEVGCGLGDDAYRMAELVNPGGSVTAVDASTRMIALASARNGGPAKVDFCQADARHLPFENARFMRCRTDRTLQHINQPVDTIAEMARVLQPEGILLAYDNDWGTFVVSGSDRHTTERIENCWRNAFANPWIGRELKRYFFEAGLSEISVYPSVSVMTDFELADQVYNLRQTASRLVKTGELPCETAGRWVADLQEQSRSGCFLCCLTAFTVVGRKPLPASLRCACH